MRRTILGSRLAVFCGFWSLIVLTLACSPSRNTPTGPSEATWTVAGRVESVDAPARLLFVTGDSIVQAHVLDEAALTGYASLDDLFAAYRHG
jgi:hypothetical protein